MANELQNKVFHDEPKARKWLESHLWPDGPVCGHCGALNNATAIETAPRLVSVQCLGMSITVHRDGWNGI